MPGAPAPKSELIDLVRALDQFVIENSTEDHIRAIEGALKKYAYDGSGIRNEANRKYQAIRQQVESIKNMLAMIKNKSFKNKSNRNQNVFWW